MVELLVQSLPSQSRDRVPSLTCDRSTGCARHDLPGGTGPQPVRNCQDSRTLGQPAAPGQPSDRGNRLGCGQAPRVQRPETPFSNLDAPQPTLLALPDPGLPLMTFIPTLVNLGTATPSDAPPCPRERQQALPYPPTPET